MSYTLLGIYCLLVIVASLAGGVIPMVITLTHRRMQLSLSFVAGLMLGVAVLHLLPHAVLETGNLDTAVIWTLAGVLVMFFLQRFLHFHHHDAPADDDCDHPSHNTPAHATDEAHQQLHDLKHPQHTQQLSWLAAAVGLGLHTLVDGVALAASVEAEAAHTGTGLALAGLATFLVIVLHKPFDALTVTLLMSKSPATRPYRHVANVVLALLVPVGVMMVEGGLIGAGGQRNLVLGCILAFAAGNFLCIAMSDLLPEIQFHEHDRVGLSVALLIGVGIAALMGQLEGANHGHSHDPPGIRQHSGDAQPHPDAHDHEGHNH
jgi:zinc and cadmium transporter